MSVVESDPPHGITDEFVARLSERADEAERLRRLPGTKTSAITTSCEPHRMVAVAEVYAGTARDVDIAAGHVVFDYDVSRELVGALSIGAKISPIAMV